MKTLSIYFFVGLLFIVGCNTNTSDENMMISDPTVKENAIALPAVQSQSKFIQNSPQIDSKKIIKEGEITFETNDLEETRKLIRTNLTKIGGYIAEETQTSTQLSRNTVNLKLSIPAQSFDDFLSLLANNAGHIESKNIKTTDVTTQYIDNKTRLDNKIALEKRYIELLQKTNKINDILAIEAKLGEIRSDIESSQGQLNYLLKQVSFSSLTVTFFTEEGSVASESFFYKFKKAIEKSLDVLSGLFFGLITIWPILLLLGLIIFGAIKYRQKHRIRQ